MIPNLSKQKKICRQKDTVLNKEKSLKSYQKIKRQTKRKQLKFERCFYLAMRVGQM